MAKQYLVVSEDQILVDMSLIFTSIREAEGDWQQVEQDLLNMLETFQGMVDATEDKDE